METIAKRLSELKAGENAQVQGYNIETVEALRLQEMGLLPGTNVTVIRKRAPGHPMEIEFRGYRLALRNEDADLICL